MKLVVTRQWLPVGALMLAAGCRDPLVKLGASGNGDGGMPAVELFSALNARVTSPVRGPLYEAARMKIGSGALVPSRLWRDSTLWTSSSGARRVLEVAGRLTSEGYRLETQPSPPAPVRLAESRHIVALTRLSDNEYSWDTDVPYAIGSVQARDVGAFVGAVLSAAEDRDEARVRADYRGALPRTTAIASQLLRLDSLRTRNLPDGSTIVLHAFTLTPQGVEGRYPNFARYLRRYAQTARARFSFTDGTARFFEMSVASGAVLVQLRTANGSLVPLNAALRPAPDTLTLTGEFTMRVRGFTVGYRNFRGLLVTKRTPRERAFTLIAREEPEWVLPLLTERLLRSPLRRPFQGDGASFSIGVVDSSDAQTLLYRRLHLEVQESAILRFIGRLGATAMSDLTKQVEQEQYAWLRELFTALRSDASAIR